MATPTLVMLAGLPGTGKSTLALALTRELGWPIIDKDIINTVTLTKLTSQADAGRLAYEVAFALAEDAIMRQRLSVILDSAGRQSFILERCADISRRADARLKVIWCGAPGQVRAARLADRMPLPSQWATDQATDDDQIVWYAHLPADTLRLQSETTPDAMTTQALAFLQHS